MVTVCILYCVVVLRLYVLSLTARKKSISMEMLKIEQVIVGSGVRSSEEIKSEPEVVPLQCCKLRSCDDVNMVPTGKQ